MNQQQLVDELKSKGSIQSPAIEAAFRSVPRHLFVPDVEPDEAYQDRVVTIKFDAGKAISSSSQPTMMALMLEQLDLQPGMRVLEIGAGSGFNAALMAHIVGEAGHVVTVDIDDDLIDAAQVHLNAAGVRNVTAVCADGAYGYPAAGSYDRILLAVAAEDITPAWHDQLRDGGRLVLPLALKDAVQVSVALDKDGDTLHSDSITPCRFMVLRGDYRIDDRWQVHKLKNGITFFIDRSVEIDRQAAYQHLKSRPTDYPSGVITDNTRIIAAITWVNLNLKQTIMLHVEGRAARRKMLPHLSGDGQSTRTSSGLIAPDGMALWTLEQHDAGYEFVARAYGDSGMALAAQLLDQVKGWDAAGRPHTHDMQITVYPLDVSYTPQPGELVIPKRSVQLVIRFI